MTGKEILKKERAVPMTEVIAEAVLRTEKGVLVQKKAVPVMEKAAVPGTGKYVLKN